MTAVDFPGGFVFWGRAISSSIFIIFPLDNAAALWYHPVDEFPNLVQAQKKRQISQQAQTLLLCSFRGVAAVL